MAEVHTIERYAPLSNYGLWAYMPLRFVEAYVSLTLPCRLIRWPEISGSVCRTVAQLLMLCLCLVGHPTTASDLFVSGPLSESEIQSSQITVHLPWSDEISAGMVSLSESPKYGQLLDDSGVEVNIDTVLLNQTLTYIPDPLFLGDDLFRLNIGGTVKTVNIYVFEEYRSPPSQLGSNVPGSSANAQFGSTVALTADGKTLIVGSPRDSSQGSDRGSVRAYKWLDKQWKPYGEPLYGVSLFERFGSSIDIDATGSTVVVGSPKASNSEGRVGAASVYTLDDAGWQLLGNAVTGASLGDDFGASVAISRDGRVIAMGAPYNDEAGPSAGGVYSYLVEGESLTALPVIYGDNAGDYAGWSVALSAEGSTLALGAIGDDGTNTLAGQVKVFQLIDNAWVQKGTDLNGEALLDRSGRSISLSANGDIVAIGARSNSGSGESAGHVRIYEYDGFVWRQLGNDLDGRQAGDNFGSSVALSGDGYRVVVGAQLSSSNGDRSGEIAFFSYQNSQWVRSGSPISGSAGDYLGWSVALSENARNLVAGSPNSDVAGLNSGKVVGFNVIKDVYLPSATPMTVAVENIPYSYAFELESEFYSLTFSATNLPAWLSFDPLERRLFGTPGSDDVGVYEDLSLWVDDGHGQTRIAQFDLTILEDTDQDGLPNECAPDCIDTGFSEDLDDDNDGVPDVDDVFPLDASESSDSDADGVGDNADAFPLDPSEFADTDGDGVGDNSDAFPLDPLESEDSDGDGVGDNSDLYPNNPGESADSDGDGVGDNADAFPLDASETTDTDGDGVGDNSDIYPNNPNEAFDTDGDGVGDNADAFPLDPSETEDTDGDGVGDNSDLYPLDPDESADSDGDGVGDNADAFPEDPNETVDTDGDGIGDNTDEFPDDPNEAYDSDGDGVGDNADAFPLDPTETLDSDGDGVGDNTDEFPNDPLEDRDSDGDGVGDNDDAFPLDPTESRDSDGDGTGDNTDAFPLDPSEDLDSDGDGVGDNGDSFPDDPTETSDTDGDGVGDNADQFPEDPTETLDTDGDGVGDEADQFPTDPSETIDTDSDGLGDNQDQDDDNDGFTDLEEIDAGSNPIDASDEPVRPLSQVLIWVALESIKPYQPNPPDDLVPFQKEAKP